MGNHWTMEWGKTPKFGEVIYFFVKQIRIFAEPQWLGCACALRVVWPPGTTILSNGGF